MSTDKPLRLVEQLAEGTRRGKIQWRSAEDATGRVYITSLPTGHAFKLEEEPSDVTGSRISLEVRDQADDVVATIRAGRTLPGSERYPALAELLKVINEAADAPLDEALKALEQLPGR